MGRVFGDGHGGHQIIITAKTDEVLKALKINREKHIAVYEEAKTAFFDAAAKLLEDTLQSVSEGKFRSINVLLSKPTSYVKQYDTAIRMFELHLSAGKETIELDHKQVDSLVHDDWDWTKGFNSTVGSYALGMEG
jgi:F0F1-type ATP synthase gamma subunit